MPTEFPEERPANRDDFGESASTSNNGDRSPEERDAIRSADREREGGPAGSSSSDYDAERSLEPLVQSDRLAQPVDAEEPPRLTFPVVGIGASAGGLEAFIEFFQATPPDAGIAYVLIQHLAPDRESMLAGLLQRYTSMPVQEITNNMAVEPNHVYVIRPGHMITLRHGRLHLGELLREPRHNYPVDAFFRSLAEEQRERAICIILSGMGSNGTNGAQTVKAVGGVAIAQDPDSAKYPSMPRHLMEAGHADFILRPAEMPAVLLRYTRHSYTHGRLPTDAPVAHERQLFGEVLAILRTRTRHDFSGYKTPTVWRRIQRRMSLSQAATFAEYTSQLRQSPSEVSALADDLMIHVTGFFRDAESWESLRLRVIVPLVAERESDSAIRCWVTACASGEEAYTLAMLIYEAAEAIGKRFDVKIFATDTAERTLSVARGGVYPVGIQGEISEARLERFFDREDAVYRIKKELREMVVFAPQNLLQDPPFSRLDVCTCRNLLIYLEPESQRRVLTLLHFGLREGGALMLGTSETVGGLDDLFDAIDKRWRIYRRLGPTRHGAVEFPMTTHIASPADPDRMPPRMMPRASVAQLTNKVLLDSHTPAAVTIDRLHRVVYFHGDTSLYLQQPSGEPTRDLLTLARESVRSVLRLSLHKAILENVEVASRDGIIIVQGERRRLHVVVAPLEAKIAPGYYLVTFNAYLEPPPTVFTGRSDDAAELRLELTRLRDELQSTIEELQTSNEEMKASSEETMSINEELQSTNEELETSKEELQSLNEELTTVNAQLQAKMEEHEATSNDLASLLSSTDIAVVFLDTNFRIRRFTPAVRDLLELIPSDIGRPLSDLARKFSDPELMAECHAVLDKLIPRESEIASTSGRVYIRRILPYRTFDNRINGVVLTFVDVTAAKQAENALKLSEERLRLVIEGAPDFAMILLSAEGVIQTWNPGAEQLLGYSEQEIVGQHASLLFPLGDRFHHFSEEMRVASEKGRAPDDAWLVRKDGVWVWCVGAISSVCSPDGTVTGYVKVMRDETGRKRAENERNELLEREQNARRDAESATHLKDRFLATLSHELRTPLSAILIWVKMLRQGLVEGPEREDGLAVIERSAEAQRQLIDDLLDTSRIASGKLRLEMVETALLPIVRAALEAVSPSAISKGVRIEANLQPDVGMIVADPDRLRQVFTNLLSNAVKFTQAGGLVTVTALKRDQWLDVLVQDDGMGISSNFMPQLFAPFTQAEDTATRGSGGLGLGLAICKQLVEFHGGGIHAESPGVGQGSTFLVRLPQRAATLGDLQIEPITRRRRVTKKSLATLDGVRLLLVEDEVPTRGALSVLLRKGGAEVTAVACSDEAFPLLQEREFDVLVSDVGLPGEDGYGLVRRLRTLERELNRTPLPAVALTAFARREDRDEAIAAGFNQHVSKPVDIGRFIELLAELLGKGSVE